MQYFNISPLYKSFDEVEKDCLQKELGHGQSVVLNGSPITDPQEVVIKMPITPDGKQYIVKGGVIDESLVTGGTTASDVIQGILDAHSASNSRATKEWEKKMSEHEMSDSEEYIIDHIGVSNMPQEIQDLHADKKALRATKP